jgi:adenosylmethionine-8-amino-7-oxononanoate aminotransferase
VRVGDTVPTPDARLARAGRTPADVAREAGDALEAYLAEHHDSVAALIVEPLVQGASGMVMYDASYLKRARELCTRYRVHLIADEIMTGFGRTGTLFACEQAGVVPDLMLLSKGITGGFLPLACVCPPTRSSARSTTTMSRAASCTRIPTRAIRSRAARRSRCSTSSATTT